VKIEPTAPKPWEELSEGEQSEYLGHVELLAEHGYILPQFGIDEREHLNKLAKAYYNTKIKKLVEETK
jgi:hypothetical protein